MINRIWNSATLMSWGNLGAKSLSIILLIPLILSHFSNEDTVLWFIFLNLFTFQLLFDLGFSATFIRIISYSTAGATLQDIYDIKNSTPNQKNIINWDALSTIEFNMIKIYKLLAYGSLIIGAFIITPLIYNSLLLSSSFIDSLMSWAVVLLSSSYILYGNSYSSYLQGIGKVALVQRLGMIFSLLSIASASLVVLLFGGIFETVLAFQFWKIVNIIVYKVAKNKIIYQNTNKINNKIDVEFDVLKFIWSSAWRSGLGVFMSSGIILLSSIVYPNFATPSESIEYLLALQLIRAISSFSQAPFYSKIPIYSKLYASKNLDELVKIASSSMIKSFVVFLVGFSIFGLTGQFLLEMISSDSLFPETTLWIILSSAFLLERFGAMHIQLYSVTNHIIWHKANGYTGLSMIILAVALYPVLGIYAFALSILISYAFVYVPYVLQYSYKSIGTTFYKFESKIFIPVSVMFILMAFVIYIIKN